MGPLKKRIVLAVITILVAASFTFILIHMMPGDPAYLWAIKLRENMGLTFEEALMRARAMIRYDPTIPIYIQYIRYLGDLIRGNLGQSLLYYISVNKILLKCIPWTLFLCSLSLLGSFLAGILIGMKAAWKRKGLFEPAVTFYASVTQAAPEFLIALILLIIFGVYLKWFPMKGAYRIGVHPGFNLSFIGSIFYHAFLPVLSYSLTQLGMWALLMRASAVSVLGEDYVTAARAKGLTESRIRTVYVGRNAILPLITTLAISLGGMVGIAVFIETIFCYPGIGFFYGESIAMRDYPLMQGIFLLVIVMTVLANLLADVLYTKLDPRVKLE
jgi:peptide/nickel transport system permease protein